MSRIKDWMMDMQDFTDMAIFDGLSNIDDILAYVHTYLPVVDEDYVRKVAEELLGE